MRISYLNRFFHPLSDMIFSRRFLFPSTSPSRCLLAIKREIIFTLWRKCGDKDLRNLPLLLLNRLSLYTRITLYTEGSKGDDDSSVEAAVFSRDLEIILKHNFQPVLLSFLRRLGLCINLLLWWKAQENKKTVIFSDSKSVLDCFIVLREDLR